MMTDKTITAASYSGASVSIFSAMTLTDWGIVTGIVTALATFGLNVWWGIRRDRREQKEHDLAISGYDRRQRNSPVEHDRRRQRGSANRVLVAVLALSAAGFSAWMANEGSSPTVIVSGKEMMAPHIPTAGDVPTIGHGSTRYEDGTLVKLTDQPITRARAENLARNLLSADEKMFRDTLPGVELSQEEYDIYMDFIGQYGIGKWKNSSMRKRLIEKNYGSACDALLAYRFQAGRDCSRPVNWGPQGCKGVWTRQQQRHKKCKEAQ